MVKMVRLRVIFLCVVLGCAVCQGAKPVIETPASKLILSNRVLVIAHRGDSKKAPENTLPAFASAVKAKADLVELDYYHSSDDKPVVFHDDKLDRTTNSLKIFGRNKIPIQEKTFAELRRLDAGSWFSAKYAGAKIPSLAEAIEVIQTGSVTLIEHKGGDALTCIRLLHSKGLLNDVVVQSFDWDYVADCHNLAPSLTLAALGSKELTDEKLDKIEKTGARVVAWNHKEIRKSQIDAIHKRGFKAWVYTVNEPKRMRRLIADGIDGIISDVPSLLKEVVAEKTP